jgi:hypothetical protein
MGQTHHHQTWLDVAVYENATEGQALETLLRSMGYEARTYNDRLFRYFLFLRPPRVTWRVQVRRDGFSDATNALQKRSPSILDQAIHCPSCGSLQVNYPQMTRKFILPTVLLHLGILFHVIEHECYCEHCHHMWNLQSEAAVTGGAAAVKHATS